MPELFRNSSPGAITLEQAIEREIKRNRERRRQAQELAAQGRGHDIEIAHVAPGEMVLPRALQTPEVMAALNRASYIQNIPLEGLRIGSRRNRINPNTGVAEFDDSMDADPDHPPPPPYDYNAPEIEGITVTTPREQGFVQLPQKLPNSGFYNYGTPGNGQGQYGLPSTMEMIGEAGSRWQATGAPPFGVGNISLPGGADFSPDHTDHRNGSQIDIRPMRSDGQRAGVQWNLPDQPNMVNPDYDRNSTQSLVDTLWSTGGVRNIFFNDPQIKGVTPYPGHDTHLHVEVDPTWTRRSYF